MKYVPVQAERQPTTGQLALATQCRNLSADKSYVQSEMGIETYLDAGRYDLEQKRIFAKRPLLVGPSAMLPQAGSLLTHDAHGVPMIVTRDKQGAVRVFLNACRHRGTRLIDANEPTTQPRLICPYHAWAYGLDGALAGVPRPETFPELNRAQTRLVQLPSLETGGLIWVYRTPAAEPDFADILGELSDDMSALGLDRLHLYAKRTHKVKANWKLIMDAFLESYHVQRLHQNSIARFFEDGLASGDQIGPHMRSLVLRQSNVDQVDVSNWAALRRIGTYTYHLFPSSVLICSPDYVNLMVLMPQAVGETLVEDFMLIPHPPQDDKAQDHWRRSWALLDGQVFGVEDFGAAEAGYKGLQSGAIKSIILGGLEQSIARFHGLLDSYIK